MTDSIWGADAFFVLTVFAMTGVTYSLRAGGFWLMGRLPVTPRVRRALEALPGAIIVSTILPGVLKGDLAVGLCLVAAVATMAIFRRDFLAVLAGVLCAALVRYLGV